MDVNDTGRCFQCPFCNACPDCADFKKVMELKDAGINIYHHSDHLDDQRTDGENGNLIPTQYESSNRNNDVFIIENTKDIDISLTDVIPVFDKKKIGCPRCLHIMTHASTLIQKIPNIERKHVMSICDHCQAKQTSGKCGICNKMVKKFVDTKIKSDQDKDKQSQMFGKFQNMLQNALRLKEKEIEFQKTYSDINIDKQIQQRLQKPDQRLPDVNHLLFQPERPRTVPVSNIHTPHVDHADLELLNSHRYELEQAKLKEEPEIIESHLSDKSTIPRYKLEQVKLKEEHEIIKSNLSDKSTASLDFDELLKKQLRKDKVKERFTTDKQQSKIKTPKDHIKSSLMKQRTDSKSQDEKHPPLRKYHSEDSLITSFSAITNETLKKYLKYFFPQAKSLKKSIKKPTLSSYDLIKETQDRLVVEADEKKKKEDEIREKKIEEQNRKRQARKDKKAADLAAKKKREARGISSDISYSSDESQYEIDKKSGRKVKKGKVSRASLLDDEIKRKGKESIASLDDIDNETGHVRPQKGQFDEGEELMDEQMGLKVKRKRDREGKHHEREGKGKHHEREGKEKHHEREGKGKDYEREGKEKHHGREGKGKDHEREGKEKHHEREGKGKDYEREGKEKHHGREGKGKDHEREGKEKHREREGIGKDYEREGKEKHHGREGKGKDHERESKEKHREREGIGKDYEREGKEKYHDRKGKGKDYERDGKDRYHEKEGKESKKYRDKDQKDMQSDKEGQDKNRYLDEKKKQKDAQGKQKYSDKDDSEKHKGKDSGEKEQGRDKETKPKTMGDEISKAQTGEERSKLKNKEQLEKQFKEKEEHLKKQTAAKDQKGGEKYDSTRDNVKSKDDSQKTKTDNKTGQLRKEMQDKPETSKDIKSTRDLKDLLSKTDHGPQVDRDKVDRDKLKDAFKPQRTEEIVHGKGKSKIAPPPQSQDKRKELKPNDDKIDTDMTKQKTGRGEVDLLNKVLASQEKEIADQLKSKQEQEGRLKQAQEDAEKKTTVAEKPYKEAIATVKERQDIGTKDKTEADGKKDSKKVVDVDVKNIKTLNSQDDLILRLVKIKREEKVFVPPPIKELPAVPVKRRLRKKKQISPSEVYSELELDIESLKNKVPRDDDDDDVDEIIIGTEICEKKAVPIKPPPEKLPTLFKMAFTREHGFPEPQILPVEEIDDLQKKGDEVPKGIVRYALSDRTFIDKGWTMLPTEKVVRKMNVYRMHPSRPEFDWFEHNKTKGFMQYDTGEKLAEFDDNGRGRWYYRNGKLALDYYDSEEINAQQRYTIYSSGEPDERGRSRPITVLGMFDYLGNGVVFDHHGKIRLKYNQTEGVLLDREIGPVTHWKWHSLNDPPVLQQVMIDTHVAYKDPDIINLGGAASIEENSLRSDSEEMLAIEFDNFIKEKSKKSSQKFKPFQIRMKALKINENFSLRVLDQASIYLLFRDGPTNLKLNLGMMLDHQEIVDTDTAELGEVSNNIERLPAKTDSLRKLQNYVANAKRCERVRTERDMRYYTTVPAASVDHFQSLISRPLRQPLRISSTATCNCKYRKPPGNELYYDTRLV